MNKNYNFTKINDRYHIMFDNPNGCVLLKKERSCTGCNRFVCFVNRNCSPEWKKLINDYKTTRLYRAGSMVYSKGDIMEGIFAIYSGKVKEFETGSDSGQIVRLAGNGEILGHRGFGRPVYTHNLTAQVYCDSEITFIPLDIFMLATKSNSDLSYYLIGLFAEELRFQEAKMRNLVRLNVQEKVVCAIHYIIAKFGISESGFLTHTPSRKDISSLAGTTYESVIRVIAELKKEGFLDVRGKELAIINPEYFNDTAKRFSC